jgi:hypothetical protein
MNHPADGLLDRMKNGEVDGRDHVGHLISTLQRGGDRTWGRVWRKLLWERAHEEGDATHWAYADAPTATYEYAKMRRDYAPQLATIRALLAQRHGIFSPP